MKKFIAFIPFVFVALFTFSQTGLTNSKSSRTATTTAVSGSTGTWNNLTAYNNGLGNIKYSARLQSLGDFTNIIGFSNFGFNIPAESRITGITITLSRFSDGASSIADRTVHLVVNGAAVGNNKASSTNWSTTGTTVTYGDGGDLWGLSSITHDQINNVNFGFQLSVVRTTNAGTSNTSPEIVSASMLITYNSTLPVELINFKALKASQDSRELTWATATETNSSHFELQRAGQHGNFETIATIKSAGNSQNKIDYSFTDRSFYSEEVVYYRLLQVDLDGTSKVLPTISVLIEKPSELTIYPNPVNDRIYYSGLPVNDVIEEIRVLDMSGKIINTIDLPVGNEVDVYGLRKGNYLIQFIGSGEKLLTSSTFLKN